jgi:SAM-dependent methyltransferase
MYFSMILVYLAVSIAAASWLFGLITVITFFLQRYQMIKEEKYCLAQFGDAYRAYADRTPRWIGIPKAGTRPHPATGGHHHGGFRPFNDPERRKWQDPEAILSAIGLKPGMTLADIGCGGGFFALPAARMVGETGRVCGLDANAAAIDGLRDQAAKEGLTNLNLTVGRAEETIVCRHGADIVFIGTALHDFQEPSQVLTNSREMLKPGGILVDLDWKLEAAIGPPVDIRFDEAKASRLIEAAGFKIMTTQDSGPYHYLIIARPVKERGV